MANENKTENQEPVEVVALERGHDGSQIREEGERFYLPAARLKDGSTWFARPEDIVKAAASTSVPAGKKPPPGAGPNPAAG